MRQVLSRAIGARAIVRSAGLGAGAGSARTSGRLERTAHAALGTAYSRDLAALGNGGDDVAALLLTLGAELVDAIANSIGRLFRLWLFHWHENKRGARGDLPQHERVLPENRAQLNLIGVQLKNAALQTEELLCWITSEARDHCDRHHHRRHRHHHSRRRVRRHRRRGFHRRRHSRRVHHRHRRVRRGPLWAGLR